MFLFGFEFSDNYKYKIYILYILSACVWVCVCLYILIYILYLYKWLTEFTFCVRHWKFLCVRVCFDCLLCVCIVKSLRSFYNLICTRVCVCVFIAIYFLLFINFNVMKSKFILDLTWVKAKHYNNNNTHKCSWIQLNMNIASDTISLMK